MPVSHKHFSISNAELDYKIVTKLKYVHVLTEILDAFSVLLLFEYHDIK